jgi:hypothetical protein
MSVKCMKTISLVSTGKGKLKNQSLTRWWNKTLSSIRSFKKEIAKRRGLKGTAFAISMNRVLLIVPKLSNTPKTVVWRRVYLSMEQNNQIIDIKSTPRSNWILLMTARHSDQRKLIFPSSITDQWMNLAFSRSSTIKTSPVIARTKQRNSNRR